jgi:hypothetical protein
MLSICLIFWVHAEHVLKDFNIIKMALSDFWACPSAEWLKIWRVVAVSSLQLIQKF